MRVVRRLPTLRRPAPVSTLATVGFEPAQRSPAMQRSLPPTPRTPVSMSMAAAQAAAPVPSADEAARTSDEDLRIDAEALQSASREVLILLDVLKQDQYKLERIQISVAQLEASVKAWRNTAEGIRGGMVAIGLSSSEMTAIASLDALVDWILTRPDSLPMRDWRDMRPAHATAFGHAYKSERARLVVDVEYGLRATGETSEFASAAVGAIKGAQLADRIREVKREVDATTAAMCKRVQRIRELDAVLAAIIAPPSDQQPKFGWFSRLRQPEQTEMQALKADAELNWRVTLQILADHRLLQPTTFAETLNLGSAVSDASTTGHASSWHHRFALGEGTSRAYSEPELVSTLPARQLTTVV